MEQLIADLMAWAAQNPLWAGAIIFIVCAIESLFVVGMLIPSIPVMLGMGALVAGGGMSFTEACAWAIAGAVFGDGVSFWIGRYYGERLREHPWVRRYPNLIQRAEKLAENHGGKSVILGRFVGPMRAFIPSILGAAQMSPWLFTLYNFISAVIWAPIMLLPGVLIGASLGLASEIASRLALSIVVILGTVLAIIWITRTLFGYLRHGLESLLGHLLEWSRRTRWQLAQGMIDKHVPETRALAVLALIFLVCSGLILRVLWLDGAPARIDFVAYQAFGNLHTPWLDSLAVLLALPGEWQVYLPVSIVIYLGLLVKNHRRAANHWLAALAFGATLAFGLQFWVQVPHPSRFFDGITTIRDFGASQIVFTSIVYAYIAALMTTQRHFLWRWPYYSIAGSLITLVAFAQLYLERTWLSSVILGGMAGLFWVSCSAFAYRRHGGTRISFIPVMSWGMVVLVLSSGIYANAYPEQFNATTVRIAVSEPNKPISLKTWRNQSENPKLPLWRIDLEGKMDQALNVQWSGNLAEITQMLENKGWQFPPALDTKTATAWLTENTNIQKMPILPQLHDGKNASVVAIYPLSAERAFVLRLWPSEHQTNFGRIWVGNLGMLETKTVAFIWHIPRQRHIALPKEIPLPEHVETTMHPNRTLLWRIMPLVN